jgi:hypothetical protein
VGWVEIDFARWRDEAGGPRAATAMMEGQTWTRASDRFRGRKAFLDIFINVRVLIRPFLQLRSMAGATRRSEQPPHSLHARDGSHDGKCKMEDGRWKTEFGEMESARLKEQNTLRRTVVAPQRTDQKLLFSSPAPPALRYRQAGAGQRASPASRIAHSEIGLGRHARNQMMPACRPACPPDRQSRPVAFRPALCFACPKHAAARRWLRALLLRDTAVCCVLAFPVSRFPFSLLPALPPLSARAARLLSSFAFLVFRLACCHCCTPSTVPAWPSSHPPSQLSIPPFSFHSAIQSVAAINTYSSSRSVEPLQDPSGAR